MAVRQPGTPAAKNTPKNKRDQGKPGDKAADSSPEPVAVDRPGFDLGGSTGKTRAGTGLGPARTQRKIAAIAACQGASGNARRA